VAEVFQMPLLQTLWTLHAIVADALLQTPYNMKRQLGSSKPGIQLFINNVCLNSVLPMPNNAYIGKTGTAF
jgi:hypothetical protein